jgi:hypothetical protein
VSGSLPQHQEHGQARSDEFCGRYATARCRRKGKSGQGWSDDSVLKRQGSSVERFYRPRDHEASPFFQLVTERFDEFERVYPDRYQRPYGFWRPIIRASIEKFLKCGDLKEGFARVRCPDCGHEFFVAFSCRQRGCCPSCDQKRALLLAYRLNGEIFARVPHRQWVFTIPKRLRVYFRYDRGLLGRLCRAAYETVREVYELEGEGVPAMLGAVQTFGDLVHWHPHIHAVVAEGVFDDEGEFLRRPQVSRDKAEEVWRDRVFALLLETFKIDETTVVSMRGWRHSGFSVDTSVRIEAGDYDGMSRLVGYIARSPFALARMITRTDDGRIVYRASHPRCWSFPRSGEQTVMEGIPRNFEVFEPLDFLAEVTQHIPNKGEHQIRYYGWYSNKSRGMRAKAEQALLAKPRRHLTPQQLKRCLTWAALIKLVYEVDPLKCPDCGGTMKLISFIEHSRQPDVVQKILRHCGLWKDRPKRGPPKAAIARHPAEPAELVYDDTFFHRECA